ncbi:MAG: DUF4249 domain-containing protein [Dysgonamonadaceae bacterium]|jgi:hypothetical protein|nr:DUF4249 domain-containing protein [Dysgonamonadaceae bacterium]
MKSGIFNIITVTALLTGFSCTERIDLPTKDADPTVVIYGLLDSSEERQIINISRSSPYFDDSPNEGVSGAIVNISSSSGQIFNLIEDESVKGMYYTSDVAEIQGDTDYFLNVEVDFDNDGTPEKYEAQTRVLSTQPGDSLSIERIDMFGRKNYILHLYMTDFEGDDYYMYKVFHNDSILNYSINSTIISDDKMFPEQHVRLNLFRFSDIEDYDDDSEYMHENATYLENGDSITVKFCRISKEYFDFVSQCQNEQGGENPLFGGPASNIITNISNGGVGFFAGCSYSSLSMIYRKSED